MKSFFQKSEQDSSVGGLLSIYRTDRAAHSLLRGKGYGCRTTGRSANGQNVDTASGERQAANTLSVLPGDRRLDLLAERCARRARVDAAGSPPHHALRISKNRSLLSLLSLGED